MNDFRRSENPTKPTTPEDTKPKTYNEAFGLTENYHHDINELTGKCNKCRKTAGELVGALKLCPVVGVKEFERYRK